MTDIIVGVDSREYLSVFHVEPCSPSKVYDRMWELLQDQLEYADDPDQEVVIDGKTFMADDIWNKSLKDFQDKHGDFQGDISLIFPNGEILLTYREE